MSYEPRPTCPKCGNDSIARILYGSFVPSASLLEEIRTKLAVKGGARFRPEKWHCNGCELEFGDVEVPLFKLMTLPQQLRSAPAKARRGH
jgi:hypothetical protein